jgi:putative transcriptional regulator
VTRSRADPGQAGADNLPGGAAMIRVRLDALLDDRGMTLTELSDRVGVTVVNLSILKNGRARAIRFSTLARLCEALGCQPGDLLGYQQPPPASRCAEPLQDQDRWPASEILDQPEHGERRDNQLR